jgi:hypothetical protein
MRTNQPWCLPYFDDIVRRDHNLPMIARPDSIANNKLAATIVVVGGADSAEASLRSAELVAGVTAEAEKS